MPNFRLNRIFCAVAALAATCAGYGQTLSPVDVRDKAIQPGQLDLDTPVSTGSRLGLTIRETPAAVYQVDRQTMESRGVRTTQEALNSVPGITATDKPDVGGFLSYRGFNGSQITQLFNGISVQYDVVAARPVNSWIYDRVEVIGGPSSFLFGAGAVGGSINYVTRLADRTDSAQGLLRYGSYGSGQAAVGFNRQLSGDGSGGNYLRLDASTDRNRSRIEGNTNTSQQVTASLLSDLTRQLTHTLALEYQHEKLERPYFGTPLLNPTTGAGRILEGTRFKNYNSADSEFEQRVQWVRSILEYRASDTFKVKNTFYHYDAIRDYNNVEEYSFNAANTRVVRSSPLLQRHDQSLVGDRIEATLNSRLGGLQSDFAFGIDYSINKQTRFPNGPFIDVSTVDPINFGVENFFSIPGLAPGFVADRDVRLKTLAVFIENRTRITPTVSVVTGLRHDRIDLDLHNRRAITAASPADLGQSYSPTTGRIGVVWDFTPNANVYVQYATAADPPAGILTTASFAQARTNTELTTGRQFEVGSKLGFWDGKAVATAAVYHIERKNLATPDPALPSSTILVGQQSSRGIELALDTRPLPGVNVQASMAFVDPQFDDFSQLSSGKAVSLAGNTPPNTPKRVGSLFVAYSFLPGWEASVGMRSVGKVFGDNNNTLTAAGYTLFDLGLQYKYSKNVTVQARVRNAGDKQYATNVTTTPMFYLGQSRTADVALRVNF